MAKMGHGWNPIDLHFSGQFDLIHRQGQSRPHDIASFEHFYPIIFLYDGFDQSEFTSAMTAINLNFFLSLRMFLPDIEFRLTLPVLFLKFLRRDLFIFFFVLHFEEGYLIIMDCLI